MQDFQTDPYRMQAILKRCIFMHIVDAFRKRTKTLVSMIKIF